MATIDKNGAIHDNLGKYAEKPGAADGFNLNKQVCSAPNENVTAPLIGEYDLKLKNLKKASGIAAGLAMASALTACAANVVEKPVESYEHREADPGISTKAPAITQVNASTPSDLQTAEVSIELDTVLTSAEDAQVAREMLWKLNGEERAERLVAERLDDNGNAYWTVAKASELKNDDGIDETDLPVLWDVTFTKWQNDEDGVKLYAYRLSDGSTRISNQADRLPMFLIRESALPINSTKRAEMLAPPGFVFEMLDEGTPEAEHLMDDVRTELAVYQLSKSQMAFEGGFSSEGPYFRIDHAGGGTQQASGKTIQQEISAAMPVDGWTSAEEALAVANQIAAKYPGIIVHDLTN